MNLSPRTVEILKNFNVVNPNGILFPEGNTLSVAPEGNAGIVAVAEIDETINETFAVYDCLQLYSCISCFENPRIDIDSATVTITDSKSKHAGKFTIPKANNNFIQAPRKINTALFDTPDAITFMLTKDVFAQIIKRIAIIQSPEIRIYGDGEQVFVSGLDRHNSGNSKYEIPITNTSAIFTFIVSVDTIAKLMKGQDYNVTIIPRRVSRFQADRLVYYMAAETDTD